MSTKIQEKLNEDKVNLYTDLYVCMRDSISDYFADFLAENCYTDELVTSTDGISGVQNYFEEFLLSLLGEMEEHLVRDNNDLLLTGNTYTYSDYGSLIGIKFDVAKTVTMLKKENKFSLKGYTLGCQETITHVNRLNILADVPQFIISVISTLPFMEEEFSEIILENYDTTLSDKYIVNLLKKFTKEIATSAYKNMLSEYYFDSIEGLEELVEHLSVDGHTTLDNIILIKLLTKYSPLWNISTITEYAKNNKFISRFEKILAKRSDKVYKEHLSIFEYFVGISTDTYLQNSGDNSSYTDDSYWLCRNEEKITFNTYPYFTTMAIIALNLYNEDNTRGLNRLVEVHSYLTEKYLQMNNR